MTWRIGTERAQNVRVLSTHVSAIKRKYKSELPYDQDKSPAFNVN